MFRSMAGLLHSLGFSPGTLFVALGQGWLSWWASSAMELCWGSCWGAVPWGCAMGGPVMCVLAGGHAMGCAMGCAVGLCCGLCCGLCVAAKL